ncbi:MAG TPA: oligosaccharide flippase family protein [Ignavibacteria bacterium]|nr:oligosaccharide flippase family protein [Ignavibacteria bacterium]
MKRLLGKYYILISGSRYVLYINVSDRLYSFIILLLLAREFSSDQYGEIVTLITFAMIVQIFFDLGLPAFLQREIASGAESESELFSISFIFTLVLLPFYIGISYLLKILIYPEIETTLFLIIFFFIYESSIVNVCNKALSGINDFRSQLSAFLISRIYILLMFITGLYILRFSVEQLMLVILSGFFLNLILIFRSLNSNSINLKFSEFSIKKIKPLLKAAIPLGLAVIFNFLYDKIDLMLISKLKDFDQAAYYNIGYGLYKSATIGFSFLLVAGFTQVASLGRNKDAVKEFFNDHAKAILIICTITGIILFVLSDVIVSLLYTGRYADASIVIKILSAGFIGLGLNNLTGITLNGMGFFKVVMYITLYGLIINVILNFFFIPLYGIVAASIISVVTEYFIFFVQYYYLRKILS